jgi:transcriptional regulator with PAS, ATPase and Fis domain
MKTNAFLQSVIQAMHDAIITTDKRGNILMINQAAENMFSVTEADITGKFIQDVFPAIFFRNKFQLGVSTVLHSVPVILNQVPIIEADELVGMNFVLQDKSKLEEIATELEVVKELQQNFNGVLSASSDGVFVVDQNGIVKYSNDMANILVDTAAPGANIEKLLNTNTPSKVLATGVPEVDVCKIQAKNCIVSHVPIMKNGKKPSGMVSIVYFDDNKMTEDIARKWFSLQQQVQYYKEQFEKNIEGANKFDQIITKNHAFLKLKKEAERIARSSSTVLITGESGVGKDMFARAIHAHSQKQNGPFVKVNCAAIPESLFESELFGYAPNSFTGASKRGKPGYFEQANGGTIFLDEIGDIPLSIQVKLLQVIQEKQFMRVGGTVTQSVDIRIIAATNRDLREAMLKNQFREDLYYRLNVIELNLPALRFRSEDILPLSEAFIKKYNNILGTRITGMNSIVKKALTSYPWPGNIRELENTIERAANYVWEGEIDKIHLPEHIIHADKISNYKFKYRMVINDIDKEIILDALKMSEGNKSAAARLLNISRSTFYDKLTRYGIN